ncbi:hypothetical protein SLS53_006303 [Cytospora paraplurivora]|uniref:Uncharacterized protein n=1 Tax=Cytospora paraplurivora TaxID=2898453 RepID=A0AAN9U2S1_9PEZI
MTDNAASPSSSPSSTGASPRRSWVPHIPAPLQRLFDAVPLVTYPPNELPYRSPAATDLPTLHVFISEQDAARGLPSFNPSCLKWQAFLRIAGVQFHVRPSTNHASPTGALPFLQPPIPSISSSPHSSSNNPPLKKTTTPTSNNQRLEATRALLPVPSTRLAAYASQHGALPPTSLTSEAATPQLQSQARRRQAYQALLDGPVRDAWLYSLYLSPANEGVLRRWYIDPVSRSAAVRDATLRQLRRAVRAELARSTTATTTTTTTTKDQGWEGLAGNVGDVLSWAMGAKTAVVDPVRIYADAARALEALETLLYREGKSEDTGAGPWFFDSPHPTLFDAAVFSYVYLVLHGGGGAGKPWADDALRQILVTKCSRLVGHTQRILDGYWSGGQGQGQAQVGQEDWVDLS